jgi:pilus assembly protein Flp/PilA
MGGSHEVKRSIVRVQLWFGGLRDRLAEQHGATAVEYALMIALIALVIVAAVTFLGQETKKPFEEISVPLST